MPLPAFLVPETILHENGVGSTLDLGSEAGPILVTLSLLETVEQQSLLIGIYGSADGAEWTAAALVQFPQKFYPGLSAVYIGVAPRFIRAQWKVDRWGRGSKTPTFRIYLFAEAIDG